MALKYFEVAIGLSSLKGNKKLIFSFEYIYIEINSNYFIIYSNIYKIVEYLKQLKKLF